MEGSGIRKHDRRVFYYEHILVVLPDGAREPRVGRSGAMPEYPGLFRLAPFPFEFYGMTMYAKPPAGRSGQS